MSALLRVVKVGGSLFDLSNLSVRLQAWADAQTPGISVFLAGGGAMADVVRTWDARFALGEERAHWLCVDLLDVTARLLCALLPTSRLCTDLKTIREAHAAGRSVRFVFAPALFLRHHEADLPGARLGRSWDVTSDSIAARLAEVLSANELVLLKSKLPQPTGDSQGFAANYVDCHFLDAARSLPRVRFVNFRDASFPEARFTR
jgi:aspartokinase-like uncharacterized kinase